MKSYKKKIDQLKLKAKKLRISTFQAFIEKKEAHLGGSFSIIEILIFLFDFYLKKEDKFILSKSHASFPYCILLKNKGFNPEIKTHLEIDNKNGIHCTTGSLGHGLPIAVGMAFARKFKKKKGRIFVLISDGECQEGTTWESFLIANKHKLNNLVILIDYNKIQALSKLKDALPLENLKDKIKSFNLNCIEIKNGHSFNEMVKKVKLSNVRTNVIIFNTIKGKGIKEFENNPVWHARQVNDNDIKIAKKRLGF